ncbi:MAG: valine--tRNA ligase [Lachnospiraceae bacterium]
MSAATGELSKTYDPKEIEDKLYEKWMKGGYFHARPNRDKKPFTIVMPPPNVTGQLHMGHALDNTMQDILIRFKRMQGYEALWQPGTDHAAIATEVKVIEKLSEQGIDKDEIGREAFLEHAWEWKEEYGGKIINQLKKLGSSADWERERFTMDEGCSEAVKEAFVRLYEKDYIYKGARIINWCPVCQTSISDAEVEHTESAGHFWHIRYPVVGSDAFVEIATTRPETMLGDTAVAVNPEDERYQSLIGKTLKLPLTDREIPVIADSYVDREFGTGCVKITPAHDPNDFEVGRRHGLAEITIMEDDATMNSLCGKYTGLDRYEARRQIVEDLQEQGLLVKIEEHVHNVGTHDRCKTVVEPMIKPQWFVKMKEMAAEAIEALHTKELTFVPERFDKIYLHWLENIRDWCISRQLWWGHRIPAYYCNSCHKVIVSREVPEVCPDCGNTEFTQDEDTLDTWFSSALWPFSTLGWPQQTEDLEYFYPTNVLVTGYDIIFFWVIRMVFSGLEHTKKTPFSHVLIHGLVRDSEGRKMSKSLGNGIDPLEVIDKYGADALRLTLMTGNAPGNDMRFYWEKVEASRNFANKIWNASRFIMMNIEGKDFQQPERFQLKTEDRWILSSVNRLTREVTENLDRYELGIAVSKIHDFLWDEFCDWYIEIAKVRIWNAQYDADSADYAMWTLRTVLTQSLKLLHPYMPFITEEIYSTLLPQEESIMVSAWPEYTPQWEFAAETETIEKVKEIVRGVRNARTQLQVPQNKKTKVYIVGESEEACTTYENLKASYTNLLFATRVKVQSSKDGIAENAVSIVTQDAVVYLPLDELVDKQEELARLEKEEKRLDAEISRATGMLSNEKFVSKAPASKIQEERDKLSKYEDMRAQVIKSKNELI